MALGEEVVLVLHPASSPPLRPVSARVGALLVLGCLLLSCAPGHLRFQSSGAGWGRTPLPSSPPSQQWAEWPTNGEVTRTLPSPSHSDPRTAMTRPGSSGVPSAPSSAADQWWDVTQITATPRSPNAIFRRLDSGPFGPEEVKAELDTKTWAVGHIKRLAQECFRLRKYPEMLATLEWLCDNRVVVDSQFYTKLIAQLGARRRSDESLRIFDLMVNSRVLPDTNSFCALIGALRTDGRPQQAITVYELMLRLGLRPTPAAYTLVTLAYNDATGWESAWNFFQQWRSAPSSTPPEAVNFNAMASVLGKAGQPDLIRTLMGDMRAKSITPDAFTYAALMQAHNVMGNPDAARRAFEELKALGIPPNKVCYDALITSFSDSGQVDDARDVLADMLAAGVAPDTHTFNALLLVCSKAGRYRDAVRMYREMEARDIAPTIVTFEYMIALCRREGLADEAQDYYGRMLMRGIKPDDRFDELLGAAVTPRRVTRKL
eukprot:TRINITY_DN14381_c0_g1_i1.p1 TRINITY_DN14381_c0_g1~~TRINITY_DN14381_c0_g1_i1.p1  ORF type:complete len:489 (-),score=66.70 TRINITY_DN14381_c0_g1_i1:192-1658(-)